MDRSIKQILNLVPLLLSILFIGCSIISNAQNNFELVVGGTGEETCSKILFDQGQIIMVGHTTSLGSGNYDICLVRTDTFGNILGNTIVGATGEDIALSATATPDHQYILTGYTNSFSADCPFAVKFDASGNMIWSKYYSINGWGEDIAALPDGSFYLTGYTGIMNVDVLLLKCDSSGNVLWARTFGDSLLDEGRKIIATSDGGALICGIKHVQAGGPTDIFAIKTDSSGNKMWSYRYATPQFLNWDMGYAIRESGENIMIGSLSYNQAFNTNPNSPDGLVMIVDSDGNVKKSFAFGSSIYDDIRDISFIEKNKFCFTGCTNNQTHGVTDLLFVIADSSGIIHQQKIFGSSSYETGLSVKVLSNNNFLIGGYSQGLGNGMNDMYLIKTDTVLPVTCNELAGNINIAPVNITRSPVFDTAFFQCSALTASYTEIHQLLPYNNLCTLTGVDEVYDAFSLSVFPNPLSNSWVLVKTSHSNKDCSIVLFDATGKKVKDIFSGKLPGDTFKVMLNENSLSAGIYFCRIITDERTETIKVIKN